MKNDAIEQLIDLYNCTSKHSNYQVLAPELQDIIKPDNIVVRTRQEAERLDYMRKHISFSGKSVIDVGGNTGYFSFEAIRLGADLVTYYEGNGAHAEFVKQAASVLNCEQNLKVHNQYLNFGESESEKSGVQSDIMLLLNVLHHVGDDYGDQAIAKSGALKAIEHSLRSLSQNVDKLIFQLGFNWKGNRNLPLFEKGTKQELIEFVSNATANFWSIDHVGIAVKADDGVRYAELDGENIRRDDSIGEFLNRPIFIMSSKRYESRTNS